MTSADFSARYKLLKRLTDKGVSSYNAQQTSTGRPVMVHFLDGGAPDANQDRLLQVRRLDPVDRAKVIETIEVDGMSVIVTQFLPTFVTLDSWLAVRIPERRPSSSPPAPVVPPPAAPVPPRSDGGLDFDTVGPTMPMRVVTPPAPPVAPPAPVVQASSPPPAPTEPEPGEFTRAFRAAAMPPSTPAWPAPPRVTPPPPVPPRAEPRHAEPPRVEMPRAETPRMEIPRVEQPRVEMPRVEPLRMEMPRVEARPEPPRADPPRVELPPPSAPGDFTRMFQGGGMSSAPSPSLRDEPLFSSTPPARMHNPLPAPEPASGRIFELALPPVTPAREPAASDRIVPMAGFQPPPESATGMMAARVAPAPVPLPSATPIVMPPPPIGAVTPAPVQNTGPSEFTRVMKGMAVPVVAASAGAAAAAVHKKAVEKAAARKPSAMPLVVALSAVFFAAVGLILYIVLKP